jgi:hypothetical protein
MKTVKAKPPVFVHGSLVLVRKKQGVDVCDPNTGVWAHFHTERHAKWSATVFTNLGMKFGRDMTPADEAFVAHIQATKGAKK